MPAAGDADRPMLLSDNAATKVRISDTFGRNKSDF